MEEEKVVNNPYWKKINKLEQIVKKLERQVEILTKSLGRK